MDVPPFLTKLDMSGAAFACQPVSYSGAGSAVRDLYFLSNLMEHLSEIFPPL